MDRTIHCLSVFAVAVDDLEKIGVEPWISLSYGNPIYAVACDGEQSYTGQKMFPLNSTATTTAPSAQKTHE